MHTFCCAVPGAWHVMGGTQGAGLSLKWFRDNFCAEEKRTAEGMGVEMCIRDRPSKFTSRWAVPAENTPAGRVPGMFSAPLGLSRQPMASTAALASTSTSPFSRLTAVTFTPPEAGAERSITVVLSRYGICSS